MGWHDMDGWDWFWMVAMMAVFWGVLVALVIALVGRGTPVSGDAHATPEEVLRQRLAHGDIGIDEYRSRLDALHEHDLPRT
jgi:uncharacterized membrane protein